MFEPYVRESNYPGFGYGYGWFVGNDRGRPVIAHSGEGAGFTSLIIRHCIITPSLGAATPAGAAAPGDHYSPCVVFSGGCSSAWDAVTPAVDKMRGR